MNKTIVFGGGCFWCTEAIFRELRGVSSVMPGYAGGSTPNPTYDSVCTGKTGHAEVSQVDYDSSQISLEDLLTVFFATHDPTSLNRQGNDVGTEYRSVIFYTAQDQKELAQEFIAKLNEEGPQVVTEVKPLDEFYPAEEYHRQYYEKNPENSYCQVIISPKLEKLKDRFNQLLK